MRNTGFAPLFCYQVKVRFSLIAPADSQIGLPSSSVPVCRIVVTVQRITWGWSSLGFKVSGTLSLVSVVYSTTLRFCPEVKSSRMTA